MSPYFIALFFSAGVAGWSYTKLIRSNGNAVPSRNYMGAAIAGVVTFVLLWTFMVFILGF